MNTREELADWQHQDLIDHIIRLEKVLSWFQQLIDMAIGRRQDG